MIAIGSPLGTYSNSVTSGIVSAKGRSITTDNNEQLSNLIQTDAAINPGNSGGPLLDAGGNVIGINTAIAQNSNGIGFAIPIDIARPIMDQAVAGEPLTRPYMGLHFVSITRQIADRAEAPGQRRGTRRWRRCQNGQPVTGVEPGKPADQAGIKDGDIIVSINDKVIDEEHPLDATLAQFSPGDTVDVEDPARRRLDDAPGHARDAAGGPVDRASTAAEAALRPRRPPTGSSAARPGRPTTRGSPGVSASDSAWRPALDRLRRGALAGAAPTSTNSSFRTGVPSSTGWKTGGTCRSAPAGTTSIGAVEASQHDRISSPRRGRRSRSSPQ